MENEVVATPAATKQLAATAQTTANSLGKSAQKPPEGGNFLWLILILWVAVIYFFFMRPQKKREQKRKNMISQVKKGNKVITIGGIHGTIVNLNQDTITIKVDEKSGAIIKLSRSAVNAVPELETEENKV